MRYNAGNGFLMGIIWQNVEVTTASDSKVDISLHTEYKPTALLHKMSNQTHLYQYTATNLTLDRLRSLSAVFYWSMLCSHGPTAAADD